MIIGGITHPVDKDESDFDFNSSERLHGSCHKNPSCHTLLTSHTSPKEPGEQIALNKLQWQQCNISLDTRIDAISSFPPEVNGVVDSMIRHQ